MKFLRSIYDFLFWSTIEDAEEARQRAEEEGKIYLPPWQLVVIGVALGTGMFSLIRLLMD